MFEVIDNRHESHAQERTENDDDTISAAMSRALVTRCGSYVGLRGQNVSSYGQNDSLWYAKGDEAGLLEPSRSNALVRTNRLLEPCGMVLNLLV